MTTPPIGHPDYQTYAQWRGTVYNAQQVTVTIAAPVDINEFVTNFASVFMRAQIALGTGVKITFNWFTDSTLAHAVASSSWELSFGASELAVIVPALANFLNVHISTLNAGNQGVALALVPTNVIAPAVRYPESFNLVQGLNVSVPASSTVVAVLPQVMEGEGQVFVFPFTGGATFQALVEELDQTNTVIGRIFRINGLGSPVNSQFMAPARPVQLTVSNTDVNPHSVDYFMTVVGR